MFASGKSGNVIIFRQGSGKVRKFCVPELSQCLSLILRHF